MSVYAIIEAGTVVNKVESDSALFDNWVLDDGTAQIGGTFDGTHLHPPVLQVPAVSDYTDAVQMLLDSTAQSRHYDGILSACTYATSSVPKFAAEGRACKLWRDAVWEKCYALLAEVESGQRQPPTVQELLSLLPTITWPEVQL